MNKFNSIIQDVTKDKRKLLMIIALGLGIIILLFSLGGNSSENTKKSRTLEEYKRELEAELSELCESIDGAGKCMVSVSFSSGESLEYHGSDISGSTPPKVLGVTVICEGGNNSRVKADICDCMMSLFDIGSNRVCVLPMK